MCELTVCEDGYDQSFDPAWDPIPRRSARCDANCHDHGHRCQLREVHFKSCACRRCFYCEGVGDVVGVKAPLGGVAQVIFQGVQVAEVGVQVRVHQDRGEEEDGEGQVEVEREVEEIRENETCATCG